jgi:hypothetical protein
LVGYLYIAKNNFGCVKGRWCLLNLPKEDVPIILLRGVKFNE